MARDSDLDVGTVVDPNTFRALENLCRTAISYGDNHPAVRSAVAQLARTMRVEAEMRYGHGTADVVALTALLRRTSPLRPPKPAGDPQPARLAPLDYLREHDALTAEQLAAAESIIRIWYGFGRFLTVQGRDYREGGSRKNRRVDPVSVMGQDLWDEWRGVYKPWYERAKRVRVPGSALPVVTLVLQVLVDEKPPATLDVVYGAHYPGWREGLTLGTLLDELSWYFRPRPARDPANDGGMDRPQVTQPGDAP
jgi:hypothetical protein